MLKYTIISERSLDELVKEVNQLMRLKPDWKPQGTPFVTTVTGWDYSGNLYHQAMIRPLDKGELDDIRDSNNHWG